MMPSHSFYLKILTGVGMVLAGSLSAPAQQGALTPPAVLMKSAAEVRQKLVGPTLQWAGKRHGIEYVRLNKNGQGIAWDSAGTAVQSIKWSVKNGQQVGLGAPAELLFVCLALPPSAALPKGAETCSQADLLRVADNAPAPKS